MIQAAQKPLAREVFRVPNELFHGLATHIIERCVEQEVRRTNVGKPAGA